MKQICICVLAMFASLACAQTVLDCKVDLALGLDGSGSVWKDQLNQTVGRFNWQAIQNFSALLVGDLTRAGSDILVAAAKFEDNVEPTFALGANTSAQMVRALQNLEYDQTGGRTRMDLLFKHFYENVFTAAGGDRDNAENIIVMMTDGKITEGFESETFRYASLLRGDGVRIVAVGVTDEADLAQLEEITQDPMSVFNVSDFSELENFIEDIRLEACEIPTTPAPAPKECPDPVEGHVSFSAYSANNGMVLYEDDMMIPFQRTYLNYGNGYDTNTYMFTCKCKGIYEFHLTMSHVNPGMMAAIMKEGEVVSPIAYTTPSGAMSTTTIIMCDANEQVYAKVLHANGIGMMPCMFEGSSFHGFTGNMLTTVE